MPGESRDPGADEQTLIEELLADRVADENIARLRFLADQLPATLWTTDAELQVTSLMGRGLLDLDLESELLDDERSLDAQRRALAGESATLQADLDRVSVNAHVEPLRGPDGCIVGTIGIALNVTEQRRTESRLREQEKQLEIAQRLEALGRLAGSVAHDFGNLLASIVTNSHTLLERMPASDAGRAEVEGIRRTAQRATQLVERLFEFSQTPRADVSEVDVNTTIENLVDVLARSLGPGVELRTRLDREIGRVRADRVQLEQVILNLATNARDAMPDGGTVTLATSSRDAGPGHDRCVVLSVSDNGIGIDPAIREQIFEPFFTTRKAVGGTGLGLASVHDMVTRSRGSVEIDSEQGRGSTFRVVLPEST